MGAWGAGLYDDDEAAGLKSTIALVAKVPASGDRLLQILRGLQGDVDLHAEDAIPFWLVVADQFERRGIHCPQAAEIALSIIDEGRDLRRLEGLEMSPKGLAKRAAVLQELAGRLRAPRPTKALPKQPRLPDFVVDTGEVYAFPTMRRAAMNTWFETWQQAGFEPDGWGAFVVVDRGRAFDWLPWCAVASLSVDDAREPGLAAALASRLLMHPQTRGAARCIPRAAQLKRMGARLLGHVALDPARAAAQVSTWTVEDALQHGWAISSSMYASTAASLQPGPMLAELVADTAATGQSLDV